MTLEEMKRLPPDKQQALFDRLTAIRKKAKVVTYSATYGVGKVKLARTTGMSELESAQLLDGFWALNWSVRKFSEDQPIRRIGGQMWVQNPVSKFWINLRYERDVFSSLNQSTGVFCFDSWLAQCWVRNLRPIGQFHDEGIWRVPANTEEATRQTMEVAIQAVNDKLQLNVPLGIDAKFGTSYSQVH